MNETTQTDYTIEAEGSTFTVYDDGRTAAKGFKFIIGYNINN